MTKSKLWFEGVPYEVIIFTDEDLKIVLRLLDEKRDKEGTNEYSRVFDRICFQRRSFNA